MLLPGGGKRFAGICQVDLSEWEESANNTTTSLLQKSPDSQAKIIFDFMYMTSDYKPTNRCLISLS